MVADTTSKPLVLYVPGLYSSTIEPKPTQQARKGCFHPQWNPPASVVLSLLNGNRGHPGLRLPLTWTKNEKGIYIQDQDEMHAGGCLRQVQNKLLQFLETLDQNDLIEFHPIAYDWRRSFEEAQATVTTQIKSVVAGGGGGNEAGRQVILMTHSTGALLSWATISQHPEWFTCWINAAGCLLYGNNMFHADFDHGWYIHFVQMLSKHDFFSFPGIYSYFPVRGEQLFCAGPYVSSAGGGSCSHYSQQDLQDHKFDVHDIATWEKYKLGIFGWKKVDDITKVEREHLQHCLATAKRFRQSIFFKNGGEKSNPTDPSFLDKDISAYDHLKIICYGTDTVQTHCAYELDLEAKTMKVSSSKTTTSGDGTLWTENWQAVPGGLKKEIIMAEKGSDHSALVNDKKLRDILLDNIFADSELQKATAVALLKH